MDTLKALGIDVALCIAGTFGCVVTLGKKAATNLRVTIASIAAGVGCANYVTPIIISSMKLEDPRWATGLTFVLGTMGLKATEIIGERLESTLHKPVAANDKPEEVKP